MQRGLVALVLFLAGANAGAARAQQIHRQDFEGRDVKLQLLLTQKDAESVLVEHGLSTEEPHGGKQCERLVVRNTGGDTCLVGYEFPKAPIIDELTLSVWLRTNRPGVKMYARVVLPNDVDPDTGKPTVVLLAGDVDTLVDRWKLLNLHQTLDLLKKKQGLLQGKRSKRVDVRGAYADALVLNIHTGSGETEVSVDDIQIGPIVQIRGLPKAATDSSAVPADLADQRMEPPVIRNQEDKRRVRTVAEQLQLGGRPFFPRAIQQSGGGVAAPLERLREAGFNTVLLQYPIDPATMDQAERLGLQVIPELHLVEGASKARPRTNVAGVDVHNHVLAWDVGQNLDAASAPAVRRAASAVRARDTPNSRPLLGQVMEGFSPVSRELEILSIRRFPLMTSFDLDSYEKWLVQRRNFARPGTVLFNTIQTHPVTEIAKMTFGHGPSENFAAPVGPQPEQMRLLTYASLAAGCRGLIFSSDWSLSDVAQGRDRMLQAALLNEELTLIEPFVAEGQRPEFCKTNKSEVTAYSFAHERGMLVMAYWNGPNTQYVLGQGTVRGLEIVVTGAPEAAQAHQIQLGSITGVKRKNGLGGTQVVLDELDTAAFVLLTTEASLIAKYQERVHTIRVRAAPLQKELAEITLAKTAETVARLQTVGRPNAELANARKMLDQAREHLERSGQVLSAGEPSVSYRESGLALRTCRLVQESLWKIAITKAKLTSPTQNPFAVSFYTLPEYYRFQAQIDKAKFGDNLLPSGDFEREGNLDAVGWSYVPFTTNDLIPAALLVGDTPQEGRRALQLAVSAPASIESKKKKNESPPVVEYTLVSMISPPAPVQRGQIVRISGFIRMPQGVQGSLDGAMVWDSLGGEALALRFQRAPKWTPFTLYRPVRQQGKVRVHLVMTGVGLVQFDGLKIEVADVEGIPLAGKIEFERNDLRR